MKQSTLLVRHLRRVREQSLAEIARDTGINVSTVSRIERGLMAGTPEQHDALADYFGRPIAELLAPAQVPEQVA